MAEKKTIEKKVKVESEKSLHVQLRELREKLQKQYLEVRSGVEKNTSIIKKTKKEIARLLTKINSK